MIFAQNGHSRATGQVGVSMVKCWCEKRAKIKIISGPPKRGCRFCGQCNAHFGALGKYQWPLEKDNHGCWSLGFAKPT